MNLGKLDAVRETPAFALLKKRLCELTAGEVADVGPVAALLARCWHDGLADTEPMLEPPTAQWKECANLFQVKRRVDAMNFMATMV